MARSEHLPIYKAAVPRYGLRPTRDNRILRPRDPRPLVPRTLSRERQRPYRRGGALLQIRQAVEQLKVLLRLGLPRYAPSGRYSG